MKKLCITLAILGVILSVAGGVITGIYATNGYSLSKEQLNSIGINLDNKHIDYSEDEVTYDNGESFNPGEDYYTHIYNQNDIADIHEIVINNSAADITIIVGDTLSVDAYSINVDKFTERYEDGTIHVDYEIDSFGIENLLNLDIPQITLTVPADATYDIVIDANAGSAFLSNIIINSLDMDLDAGNITITDSEITNKAEIDVSAGELYISNTVLNNIDIDKTAGDVSINQCYLYGKTNMESTAGDMNIDIIGNIEDYSFNVSKTAGNVYINNKTSIPDNSSAENNISVEITAGNCTININP